jgi:hypothetical protein
MFRFRLTETSVIRNNRWQEYNNRKFGFGFVKPKPKYRLTEITDGKDIITGKNRFRLTDTEISVLRAQKNRTKAVFP